jgi:hypothetical protein
MPAPTMIPSACDPCGWSCWPSACWCCCRACTLPAAASGPGTDAPVVEEESVNGMGVGMGSLLRVFGPRTVPENECGWRSAETEAGTSQDNGKVFN